MRFGGVTSTRCDAAPMTSNSSPASPEIDPGEILLLERVCKLHLVTRPALSRFVCGE